MRYSIAFIILFTQSNISSQEIIPYKDKMTAEKYDDLTTKEATAYNESDLIKKSILLQKLAGDATRYSHDLGKIFYDKALAAAKSAKSDSMIARITLKSSIPLLNESRHDEARERLNFTFEYATRVRDTFQLAEAHGSLAYLERLEGSVYLAIRHATKAKEYIIPTP